MFEFNAPIDTNQMQAVATGHAQTMERWEDTPAGRRSSGQPLIDEATGAPVRSTTSCSPPAATAATSCTASASSPTRHPSCPVLGGGAGRAGRQGPPGPNGGKGVDVSFNAEAIRPAAVSSARAGRRAAEGEAA